MVNLDEVVLPDPKRRAPGILVVEDEIIIRLTLSGCLKECGFVVFDAGNAAEAVAVLENGDLQIDVVLTDVCMPGEMDGFGLARWIKRRRPGLPVLITTGDRVKAETARDICGKSCIIDKPHDLKLLVARVRAAIADAKKQPS